MNLISNNEMPEGINVNYICYGYTIGDKIYYFENLNIFILI